MFTLLEETVTFFPPNNESTEIASVDWVLFDSISLPPHFLQKGNPIEPRLAILPHFVHS
jgi:hypothetical protein